MTPNHVVAPGDFLDRSRDREHLIRLLREGRNVLLYGPRRIGKTSLLERLAEDLRDEFTFLRVDSQFCTDPYELARLILRALGRTGIAKLDRFLHWVRQATKGLQITIHINKDGIVPGVESGTPPPEVLDQVLEFISRISRRSKKPLVLSLDEFQDIMTWDERQWNNRTVSTLRSYAQTNPRMRVIITGSQTHMILGLTRIKNPFWKQLTEFRLGAMDVEEMADDYERLHGFIVPPAAREVLREELGKHTNQLIQVLDITRRRMKDASEASIRKSIEAAILDNLSEYDRILDSTKTALRRRLLIALAVDRPEHPTGHDFLQENRLGTGAGVAKSLQWLREHEILDDENEFLDPLLREYLRRNAP